MKNFELNIRLKSILFQALFIFSFIIHINIGACFVIGEHDNIVISVDVTENGRIVSGSYDRTIRVWEGNVNIYTNPHLIPYNDSAYITSLAIGKDINDDEYIVSGSLRSLNAWNLSNLIPEVPNIVEPQSTKVSALTVSSADEKIFIRANYDKQIKVFQIDNEKMAYPFQNNPYTYDRRITSLAANKDYIIGGGDRAILIIGFNDGSLIRTLEAPYNFTTIVQRCSSQTIPSLGYRYHCFNTCVSDLGHCANVNTVAIVESNGVEYIVSGSSDNTIKIWDLNNIISNPFSNVAVNTLEGHCSFVTSIVPYEDIKGFISVGGHKKYDPNKATVIVWEPVTSPPAGDDLFKIKEVFVGHSENVRSVAYDAGNNLIVTGGNDNLVLNYEPGKGTVPSTPNDYVDLLCMGIPDVEYAPERSGPIISVTPRSEDFGCKKIGDGSVLDLIIKNVGNQPLDYYYSQPFHQEFEVDDNDCTNKSPIPVSGFCRITVTFSPQTSGLKNYELEIHSNDPYTPVTYIQLTGIGLTANEECTGTNGAIVTSDLWIRAAIKNEEKEIIWQEGGQETTSAGDKVIFGHFYASSDDVSWGNKNNPELFVKIWFDRSGRIDVNYFHVSVPDIEVYSDYKFNGIPEPDETSILTLNNRYVRHYFEGGKSNSEEIIEDGISPDGYSQNNNPSGSYIINGLKIGTVINTLDGPIKGMWKLGGYSSITSGDKVAWGYFYANPDDVTWGSENNPELFIKIWFDNSGRIDVNYFHVSVPDIEVYSDYPGDGIYDQTGTAIMGDRYIRHEFQKR